jgi:glycine cleavage system H protein
MSAEPITFMGTHWVVVEGNSLTIGLNEEGLDTIDEIDSVSLPSEGESFEADDICAELSTSDGPINVYTPVAGSVVEINSALADNPDLVKEDSFGEGWLFKIEASSDEELSEFVSGASYDS